MAKPQETPGKLFITVKEAANIIHVHPHTLYGWIRDGKGPPVQRFGGGKTPIIRIISRHFMKWVERPSKGRPHVQIDDSIRANGDGVAASVQD